MDSTNLQIMLTMMLAGDILTASWQPHPDDREFRPLALQRTDETKEHVAYMQ